MPFGQLSPHQRITIYNCHSGTATIPWNEIIFHIMEHNQNNMVVLITAHGQVFIIPDNLHTSSTSGASFYSGSPASPPQN